MSWPLAAFAIVAGALVLGWLAYERARPSARTIAVVATLAALAALGRDAFAALPDVKPITAMTFVVGYTLGPLAGFMVGALGMLASNILLGQGPYTPWQMAAWGCVGLAGALLGRLSGRRLPRPALALACAVAALAAKEIMNVYVFSLGGVYTRAALLARVGEGLPFDLADTVSSFFFGLAFGPELARLLLRVRSRLRVRWEPVVPARPAAALAALALLAGTAWGAGAPEPAARAAAPGAAPALTRARAYLERAQGANGGFGGSPGGRPSELYSAWAAIGLAAAGRDPLEVSRDGHSVLDALRSEAATLEGTGDFERTMLALRACGAPAASLAGVHLEAPLLAAQRPDGSFGGQVNLTAFAVLALRASGHGTGDQAIARAGRWLEGQQGAGGGFGFAARGASSDVDDTAAAIEAIVAAGASSAPSLDRAVSYLRGAQDADGGFPQEPGGESNAQSTAWAIQGLVAARAPVDAMRRGGGPSPLQYLEGLVAPDGSVRYSRTSTQTPVWVTAEALTALAGKPLPIAPVRSGAAAPARPTGTGSGHPARTGSRARQSGQTRRAGTATRAASRAGVAPGESLGGAPEAIEAAVTASARTLARATLAAIGALPQAGASSATASAAGTTESMRRAHSPA